MKPLTEERSRGVLADAEEVGRGIGARAAREHLGIADEVRIRAWNLVTPAGEHLDHLGWRCVLKPFVQRRERRVFQDVCHGWVAQDVTHDVSHSVAIC